MKTRTTILIILCSLVTAHISSAATTISQKNWSVWYVDSEETAAENGMAENAFDGNSTTFWHTEWSLRNPVHPHEIQINLGKTYDISGFRYLPRQDGTANGNIARYEFYVSEDGSNWGSPVAAGSFTTGASEREVSFTSTRGQFIRLKANSEINGKPWTAVSEINVISNTQSPAISQDTWSLLHADSEEIVAENGMAENAFDGNSTTFWHTEWYNSAPKPPHEIGIDLGGVYDISGFRYLPRQDGTANGNIARYEFYVSEDGSNWGSPVAAGSFTTGASEREVSFTSTRGQFIRLKANSEINGKPWTAVSEINVVGECSSPSVRIISPLSYAVLSSTTIRATANACLDPTLHAGWGVKFTIDGALAVNDYAPPYEATFSGAGYSNHTIQATLIDAYGNMATGFDAFDQVEQIGVGDYYVAVGDSITFGEGDNISYDDTSEDDRNTGGGYEPVLNDLLTAVKGYPHTIVNQGRPGYTSSLGLRALPLILQRYSNAKYFLIQYGTNDPGARIKSGVGLEPGDYGYYGSFKDNMQRMIDLVRSKGKEPFLAKVPYALGSYSSRNAWYLEYNEAIDELALSNALKADPPDLYGYFQANEDEYSDYLHPNGYGYRSIADLWFSSLY